MIKRILLIVLLSLAGGWAVRQFMLEGIYVASGSMEPTLPLGTHYFVNKMVYHFHPPLRGEIIVFKSPLEPEIGLIKRTIAVAGDEVAIHSKQVFLNGNALTEPYAVFKRSKEELVGDNMVTQKVPDHHLFVLGDNRDESEDSSVWKDPKTGERIYFIPEESIEGRLIIP